MNQATVPAALLKAALQVAPKKDVRHYLNAVRIEARADELRVVATDGHRLFIAGCATGEAALPGWAAAGLILDREWLADAVTQIEKLGEDVVVEWGIGHARAVVRDPAGDFCFRIAAITATYPDYQRVVEANSTALSMGGRALDSASLNPAYLKSAATIAAALGATATTPFVSAPDTPAMFSFAANWPAVLYISPIKSEAIQPISDATLRLVGSGLKGTIAALRAYQTRLKSQLNVANNDTQREALTARMESTAQRIASLLPLADARPHLTAAA